MRPLVAGNWKMNGLQAALGEVRMISAWVADARPAADVLLCPPVTILREAAVAGAPTVAVGGQNAHAKEKGAHTGDISAEMLRDAGATAVILGHSERRADHGETDAAVRSKTEGAWRAGLLAIVCVGETEAERLDGRAEDVVGAQLAGSLPDGVTPANTVVAYEPVWAIGTGRTPTIEDIAAMHAFMARTLSARFATNGAGVRLLYGGSVKASNAVEIAAVPHVNGALVGGASLTAGDFTPIIAAFGAR